MESTVSCSDNLPVRTSQRISFIPSSISGRGKEETHGMPGAEPRFLLHGFEIPRCYQIATACGQAQMVILCAGYCTVSASLQEAKQGLQKDAPQTEAAPKALCIGMSGKLSL